MFLTGYFLIYSIMENGKKSSPFLSFINPATPARLGGGFKITYFCVKSCAGFLLDKIAQLRTANSAITTTQPNLPKGVKSLW